MPSPSSRNRILMIAAERLDSGVQDACFASAVAGGFQPILVGNGTDISSLIDEHGKLAVIRAIRSIDELKDELFFIREYRRYIENEEIFPIALNWLGQRQVTMILHKMGFRETISVSELRPSALKPRLLSILEDARKVLDRPDTDTVGQAVDFDDPGAGKLVVRENRLELGEPLEIIQNCWLLRRPEDIRIVRGHWVVEMVGPGPSAGKWLIRPNSTLNPSNGHALWEWKPNQGIPSTLQTGLTGRWVFSGKRPKFDNYHWSFISRTPSFSFFDGEAPPCVLFSMGPDNRLIVARNSKTALSKWADIHTTILGEMRIHKEAEVIQQLQVRFNAANQDKNWRDSFGVSEMEEKFVFQGRTEIYAQIEQKFVPKPQLFNLIQEDRVRSAYLKEVRESHTPVLVWTTGQATRFHAAVMDVISSPDTLLLQPPPELRKETLKDTVFVCISYLRGGLFFSVGPEGFRWDSTGRLAINIPRELYEVQRRNHFRLAIPESDGIYVRIEEQFYRILTLSAGGFSFLADSKDLTRFPTETILENVSFEINAARIRCKAEVRWNKVTDTASGTDLSVGIQFHDLHPNDRQRINLFVMESGYEYLKHYLLEQA